jgi:hypothetical protein
MGQTLFTMEGIMYLDQNGLIVQQSGDGGDTAARTGFYFGIRALKSKLFLDQAPLAPGIKPLADACNLLIQNGYLIRNPVKYNNPKGNDFATSRDQTTPMVIACGLCDLKKDVEIIQPKGFLLKFYPNWDPASPSDMNTIKRALDQRCSDLGDFWSYLGTKQRCDQAKTNQDDVGDDVNCFISLVFNFIRGNERTTETLKYYLKNRPINYGVTQLGEKDNVMGALKWYFRPTSGGNDELAEQCRNLVEYLRKILRTPVL